MVRVGSTSTSIRWEEVCRDTTDTSMPIKNNISKVEKLLVGDSITKHVDVSRMFPRNSTNHIRIPTFKQACKTISEITSTTVDTVIYHLGTNDLKDVTPTECLDRAIELVNITRKQLSNALVMESEVIKRHDNKMINNRIDKFNELLSKEATRPDVYVIKYNPLSTTQEFYARDGIHINPRGTAKLVYAIKEEIRKLDTIDYPRKNGNGILDRKDQVYNNTRNAKRFPIPYRKLNSERGSQQRHHAANNKIPRKSGKTQHRDPDKQSYGDKDKLFLPAQRQRSSHSTTGKTEQNTLAENMFSKFVKFMDFMNSF
uniref:Uncharacterized protein LOC102808253 n=1 Tax=Saccoglossus kowalevskii TaxID=10224 RepID=A0ABM0MXG5_SACKO|nr:PREDICTED: uncharacterized protein LOC102808253 [Saccoglossus kowalevskii]